MIKTQTMSENGEIYTAGKIYTAAGSDRRDKSHLWILWLMLQDYGNDDGPVALFCDACAEQVSLNHL